MRETLISGEGLYRYSIGGNTHRVRVYIDIAVRRTHIPNHVWGYRDTAGRITLIPAMRITLISDPCGKHSYLLCGEHSQPNWACECRSGNTHTSRMSILKEPYEKHSYQEHSYQFFRTSGPLVGKTHIFQILTGSSDRVSNSCTTVTLYSPL
ncbi:hypothetical protein DPMN_186517 [Dreissena polymorpha]|uniref:Uncharacterized protein n=1 Tax=Dreissena polymorpha TaxID=45954 RepID=A0A9D4DP80_DREPO|nr:hypothetical protein DPMN_186517 [Dreissena polymorpha]